MFDKCSSDFGWHSASLNLTPLGDVHDDGQTLRGLVIHVASDKGGAADHEEASRDDHKGVRILLEMVDEIHAKERRPERAKRRCQRSKTHDQIDAHQSVFLAARVRSDVRVKKDGRSRKKERETRACRNGS